MADWIPRLSGSDVYALLLLAATLTTAVQLAHAKSTSKNGAGIRQEGANLTVRYCYFHDNEDGILANAVTGSNQIPLSTFSRFVYTSAPLAIAHQEQFPSITISFNLAPNVPLGDATKQITAFTQEIKLPSSVITSYGGDAQVFQQVPGRIADVGRARGEVCGRKIDHGRLERHVCVATTQEKE